MQSQGQKVQIDIKSNVPNNSTDEDKYQEGTRYREAMKYLKEKLLLPHWMLYTYPTGRINVEVIPE